MIAASLWVAVLWPDSEGAVLASIASVIFTGLVANLIIVQFVQSGPAWLATLLELFPSFALFRGLYEMSQYAFLADVNGGPGDEGVDWVWILDPLTLSLLLCWPLKCLNTHRIPAGLNFSMLGDANNGMVEAWVIMGVETLVVVGFSMWYEAVRWKFKNLSQA